MPRVKIPKQVLSEHECSRRLVIKTSGNIHWWILESYFNTGINRLNLEIRFWNSLANISGSFCSQKSWSLDFKLHLLPDFDFRHLDRIFSFLRLTRKWSISYKYRLTRITKYKLYIQKPFYRTLKRKNESVKRSYCIYHSGFEILFYESSCRAFNM